MYSIIIYFIASFVIGAIAKNLGLSGIAWTIVSLFISPIGGIIGVIIAYVLKDSKEKEDTKEN